MAVKITSILEKPLQLLAPHYCYGCGIENSLLCEGCCQTVVNNDNLHCYRCFRPTAEQAVCSNCRPKSPFEGFFVAGEYNGALEGLLHGYKFQRSKAGALPLGRLLEAALPYFDDPIVTHIPTAPAHVRVRGYDHAALIAAELALVRGWRHEQLLTRLHNKRQLGATRQRRRLQADSAFEPKTRLKSQMIILVDDVTTSGATMEAAAWLLLAAGARSVVGVVVAQQRLT